MQNGDNDIVAYLCYRFISTFLGTRANTFIIRGNNCRLQKNCCKFDLQKYYFTKTVIDISQTIDVNLRFYYIFYCGVLVASALCHLFYRATRLGLNTAIAYPSHPPTVTVGRDKTLAIHCIFTSTCLVLLAIYNWNCSWSNITSVNIPLRCLFGIVQ